MSLSGIIDTDSLCKLRNLRVLSLAKNLIRGSIPDSISNCRSLTHLNLSSNLLNGTKKAAKLAEEKEILRALSQSPQKIPTPKTIEVVKPDERQSELVFFVEENERFKLEDLLDSAADLQSQSLCSSLYKTISQARGISHGNIGCQLHAGIARGLDFLYGRSDDQESITPHGNIKLSNIMLNENEEPLISEYGYSRFQDPNRLGLCTSKGYEAPEKCISEKGDVFSFGVILMELLTGKSVEKTGLDLPKWVKSMVREEWTGEVFDKEVSKFGMQWAFPLLNISLKCVSHSPEERPTMAEVWDKIEEVVNAHEDISISPMSSVECNPQDTCILHTLITDTWDTPGSNY
ncbi:hypothetical protein L1049_001310 [Liquidambar formosana]|uniref:Protein kinase domain-containing protein n=1 Tax=Liquidambar formosana TaxID=63359 RepID=A0AAP0R640_LIQFO